jgi:hypothetical protein
VNEILQKTYDVLEKRGWCQHRLRETDGRVCLEGAFRLAAGYDYQMGSDAFEAWTTLCAAVYKESSGGPFTPLRDPATWNDQPERTVEDVKLLLKKAIHADD